MGVQIVLTVTLGFGVLTIATIAILNVIGNKVHEVVSSTTATGAEVYVYLYSSDQAQKLRGLVAKVPGIIGLETIFVVLGLFCLYGLVDFYKVDIPFPEEYNIVEIITWLSITMHVYILVVITAGSSVRLFKVISSPNQNKSNRTQ